MKMSCVLKLMFLLLSPMALAAGPSDGGGTNLFEDQLVDFQKFETEFGVKQYVVDGRKMKAKGGITPYDDVKPLLSRFTYLYPGLGNVLEDTFEKDWIVLDAKFTARKTGETKAISQTGEVVYVSLPWLKNASPDRVREAFTHEAVRNLAHRIVGTQASFFQLDADARRAIEDQFTETVTPVVYRRLPARQLEQTLRAATDKLLTRVHEEYQKKNPGGLVAKYERAYFSPREHFYKALKISGDTKELIQKLCEGIHSKTRETPELRKRIEERLVAVREMEVVNDLGWLYTLGDLSFDGDTGSITTFYRAVMDGVPEHAEPSRKLNAVYNIMRTCKAGFGNEEIRKDAEREGYMVRDPIPRTHEHVPMDDEASSGVRDVK